MNLAAKRKIIFDMDGVITSEERYWDAAALTVWELLFGAKHLGVQPFGGIPDFKTDPSPGEIATVRRIIFCEDRVIAFFKQQAINSNWDIAYLTFIFHFIAMLRHLATRGAMGSALSPGGKEGGGGKGADLLAGGLSSFQTREKATIGDTWKPTFAAVLDGWSQGARGSELIKKLFALSPAPFAQIFGSSMGTSPLWPGIRNIFQQWYLGEGRDEGLPGGAKKVAAGKRGLLSREEPILEISRIKHALDELLRLGWKLGIATGRPLNELLYPLEQMGISDYFEGDSVITHDHVLEAQEALGGELPRISLGKPHPFPFLKAYWGKEKDDRQLAISPPLPPKGACWVVGDTMADLLAAREAGAGFAAVLTGPGGEANRELFAREGAAAVLPDMTRLPDFLRDVNDTK